MYINYKMVGIRWLWKQVEFCKGQVDGEFPLDGGGDIGASIWIF